VPKIRKATKLKQAAQTTACFGERTRVETMVETELAASCMPLVKSKTRAIATMTIIKTDTTLYPMRCNTATMNYSENAVSCWQCLRKEKCPFVRALLKVTGFSPEHQKNRWSN
jgi:hypothetical protein